MKVTNRRYNRPSTRPLNRSYAVEKTKELLLNGPNENKNCLVQPPPTVHPEEIIPELIAAEDIQAAIMASTNAQVSRIVSLCRSRGISTRTVDSRYDKCNSYNGGEGSAVEKKVKQLVNEVPLGLLHRAGSLPCCSNCPYTNGNRPKFTEQVVVMNPIHAYIEGLIDDRVVFTSALRDAYLTEIEEPSKALNSYLDDNTEFGGYRDFIENRTSGRRPSVWDYIHERINPSTPDEQFGYSIKKNGHHLAPKIIFGLLQAEKLDNGWETTVRYKKDQKGKAPVNRKPTVLGDRFDIAGVDYRRTRVVRQPGEIPEDDTIYILDSPDFTKAKSVVAFDVAPTPWMWRTYYGANFDHQRVYDDNASAKFLRREMDAKVVQTATSRKPYDGMNVTPGRDASIAVWATAEYGKSPVVVSTRDALGEYRSNQPELLSADAKNVIKYRSGNSVIGDKSPLVILNGSPRPQNEAIQLWGALAGKSVRNPGKNQSFGEAGKEIRHQFCESRVAKWATRFDSRNAIIVLNTTAVPEWLNRSRLVTREDPLEKLKSNAYGQRRVARYLRDNSNARETMDSIQKGSNVSENTAEEARDDFIDYGWVAEHSTDGDNSTEYSWVA